jgi:putative endonuclease
MSADRRALGIAGERLAEKELTENAYHILERNYRSRYGEIDLVAKDGPYLVFIEVKTRSSASFALPEAAVNFTKRQKISRTAQDYLKTHKLMNCDVRFDVVTIVGRAGEEKEIEIIRNAFEFVP